MVRDIAVLPLTAENTAVGGCLAETGHGMRKLGLMGQEALSID